MKRHSEEFLPPKSIFDRPSPALLKMRRDMKMHKYRAIVRAPVPVLKTSHMTKASPEPDHAMDWLVDEEWALLHPIQSYQNLPLSTMILSPGHTPNWDMVSDTINNNARLYRSAKHCRGRYETVIMPREEGKLIYDVAPKKQKKQKGSVYKTPQVSENKANRSLRTSQLHNQDKNNSFTMMGNQRYEIVKSESNKRTPTVKPLLINPLMRHPTSAAILLESGIQIENPMVPIDVATKRANRIAKEKQKHAQVLTQQQQQQQVRLLQQQQAAAQQQQQQQTQQQQAGQQGIANSVGSQIHQLSQAIPAVTSASGAIIGAKAVVTSVSLSNVPTTTVVTTTVKARPSGGGGQMAVQDARTTSTNVVNLQQSTQRIATASLVSASQASVNAASGQKGGLVGVTVATAASASKTAAQLQYYRQQQVLLRQQQQQQQLKVLQAQAASGQKVSVTAMSATAAAAAAAAQQRTAAATLMKQGIAATGATGTVAAQAAVAKQTVTRTVSDPEMAALLKRQMLQQQAKAAAAAAAAVAQVQVSILLFFSLFFLLVAKINNERFPTP